MVIVWSLFFALLCYNILDVHVTYMVIQLGLSEANPLLSILIDKIGLLPTLIGVKSFWFIFLGILLYLYGKKYMIVRREKGQDPYSSPAR